MRSSDRFGFYSL